MDGRGCRIGVVSAPGVPMHRRGRELGVVTVVVTLAVVGRHVEPRAGVLRAITAPNGRHRTAWPRVCLILHLLSAPALLMIRRPPRRPPWGSRGRRVGSRGVGACADGLAAAPPRRGRGNPLQSASGYRGLGASRRVLSFLGRVSWRGRRGCDGDAKGCSPGDVLCLLLWRLPCGSLCLSGRLICRGASALAARDSCHGGGARACRCARSLLERKSLK